VLVLKRQIFVIDIRTKADKNSLLCCSILMSTQCVLVQSKQRLGHKKSFWNSSTHCVLVRQTRISEALRIYSRRTHIACCSGLRRFDERLGSPRQADHAAAARPRRRPELNWCLVHGPLAARMDQNRAQFDCVPRHPEWF
jgi:hypothetical protein